jgi:hypothetical protein
MKAQPIPPVPEATTAAARAAFRKGNVYMQMRDELGSIYTDDLFADLYPAAGHLLVASGLSFHTLIRKCSDPKE